MLDKVNPMRFLKYAILIVALAPASAAEFVIDGGMAYVGFTNTKYETNPDPSYIISEDRGIWSPFVGVRAKFSEMLSLRLGYQYLGTLDTHAVYAVPPGPGNWKPQVITPANYRSRVHSANLGFRFSAKVNPAITVFASPEANWIFETSEVRYYSLGPTKVDDDRITIGAALGVTWNLNSRCDAEFSYRYIDAGGVWSREAHSFGISVSFRSLETIRS